MDLEEELVPADDSVFDCLINDSLNFSSDAFVDDSFSSVLASTPVAKRGKGRGSETQQRPLSPASPQRRSARLSVRAASPNPTPSSPSSSPRRSSRLASNQSSPSPSSPRSNTRSKTTSQVSSTSQLRLATSSTAPLSTSSQPRPTPPSTSSQPRTTPPSTSSQPRPTPPSTSTSRVKCRECTSTFSNERTFAVHKRLHALKRAFRSSVTEQEFLENLPNLFSGALNRILKEPCIGEIASDVHKFVKVVQEGLKSWSELHELFFQFLGVNLFPIICDTQAVFSSSLSYVVHVRINKLLNSKDFTDNFKKHMTLFDVQEDFNVGVFNLFLGSSVLHLSSEIIIFTVRKIHGVTASDVIRRKRGGDKSDSDNFLQLVYYIGGSVVNGFLYKGLRYKSNPNWDAFVGVLKSKFLRNQAVGNECADNVTHFAKAKDRGGLKHICQEALDFFLVVFDLLMSLEGADGSLPPNVVTEHVLGEGVIVCLWDVLVGSDLEENTSLDFLMQMAETCKLIVMKGIIKRRLNDSLKKSFAAVPLRSRLAQ